MPKHLIVQGVNELWAEVEASAWAAVLKPLFDYFHSEWVPRLEELSVYGQAERTNNCSESDNHMLANEIPQNHPNIWHMISKYSNVF